MIKPKSKFADVAGKKTQLLTGGDGPPLLYLHSAGGETEWTGFQAALAEHFTVYLPAHPGFANSEGLDRIDHISDMAWHTVDLLAELGLDNVPAVGFSLGAWLACEMAILRPALFSKLVLVDAAGLHVDGAPMPEIFIDDLDKMRNLLFHDPNDPAVAEAMPQSIDDPRMLLWLRAREATARVGWNPYLHNPNLPEHLHRITCPVKILWGREDKLIPLAHGEKYAELLPRAELTVLDQCGHMLPFEQPERFVEEVVTFLR